MSVKPTYDGEFSSFSVELDWTHLTRSGVSGARGEKLIEALVQDQRVMARSCSVLSDASLSVIYTGKPDVAEKLLRDFRSGDVCDDAEGAFVFFDWENQRIVGGTDRLGTVPVYHHCDDTKILLATSPGPLISALPSASPSAQSLYNYVYFHVVPAPRSARGALAKLSAAETVTFNSGVSAVERYWSPAFLQKVKERELKSERDQEAAFAQLRSLLKDAVAKRLPEDGGVGAFLSGGLDSSSVVGMLSELTEHCQAFVIGFEAEGYDEIPYARISAEHFGARLHEFYVKPDDVVDVLPQLAASFDEPFGNSSALPAYFCAKMAAEQGVNTLLAGDGGDELFAGNERYAKQRVFERYRAMPAWLRRMFIEPTTALLPGNSALARKSASFLKQANIDLPERLWSYSFLEQTSPASVFSEEFIRAVDAEDVKAGLRATYECTEGEPTLDRMLHLDWQVTLADNDLRKVNQACALANVRVEYPMLDSALLDFSIALPSRWKLRPGELRAFYRSAMRGWLPDATLDKNKHGFGLPFGVWMREHAPLRELAHDSVSRLGARGIFKPSFLEQAIKQHQTGHAAYFGELIWVLCALELWLAANADDFGTGGFR